MKQALILLSLLALTSCGTMRCFKTSDFAKIDDINALEGTYSNKSEAEMKSGLSLFLANDAYKYRESEILSCFHIRDSTDVVYITTESPNEMNNPRAEPRGIKTKGFFCFRPRGSGY